MLSSMERRFLLAYKITGDGSEHLRKKLLKDIDDTDEIIRVAQVKEVQTTIKGVIQLEDKDLNYGRADVLVKKFLIKNNEGNNEPVVVDYIFLVSGINEDPCSGTFKAGKVS